MEGKKEGRREEGRQIESNCVSPGFKPVFVEKLRCGAWEPGLTIICCLINCNRE